MSVCEQPVNFQVENNNDTNIDTSVNGILRIAASPLNIKTQIAKMSYNSGNKTLKKRCLNKQTSCLNEEDNSTGPELKTLNKTDPLATEENEKEEQEEKQKGLDTYLTENTYKPIQKIILAENDKHISDKNRNVSGETVPMFRRSKTEIIENKLGSQSERRQLKREGAKIRSKSCRLPETKSDDLLPSVTENKKRKSYNVEETRKFLEDQKRRRRSHIPTSTLKLDTGKTNIEKEQIKKRLEELRKNSRAIIAKNVNRKKCPVISQINIKNGGKKSTGDKAKTEHSLRKDKLSSNCELSKKTSETVDDCSDLLKGLKSLCTAKIHNEPEQQLPIKVSQMHKEKTKVKSPNSPYLLNKRIGLLRKQETKDHSFSAIREFSFDKDNIALEMMTPKLRESVPLNPKTVSNSTDLDARRNDFPDKTKESMTIVNESKLKCLLTDEISKENNISSMKESGTKPHIKMDNKVNTIPEKDLPYWLKPSTVQIYPYNFIMAVRRKLEALADVRTQPTGFDMEPKSCFATKDLSLKNKAKGEIILSKGTDSARSEESLLTHNVIPFEQKNSNSKESCMNSHSEIHSNLSSISIKLRSESTVSESVLKDPKSIPLTYAKSKVFEATSEDDTTISSSIFNSADRNIHDKNNIDSSRKEELQGTISPLSLERVENLTIMSNKKLKTAIAIRHVNTNRGDTPTNNKEDTADIDFNRLLHDFNNSLSQVIEVNDRLKATINKSQEICGSIPTDSCNSKQSDQYTADFEKNCSDQSLISPCGNNDIKPHKDHIKDAFDDQKKYDYSKLESVALGSKDSDDSPSKASNPNSKSYTNSSLSSRNSNGQYEILSLFKEDLDKRLHKIRNIKEKYKQIIINLQKNRNKDESLKQYLTPANISERKENEILSKKMEDEEKKTNSEIKVQCETLNPSYFISCHKSPDTPIRNQIKANQQHFASKNISTSRKILEMFDHTHLEISMGSTNNDSLSDSTCSYSNLGVYEKLIRNETIKSEHLTALLKMREKALFDRTKGQIAWLEVQKERCKSKGLLLQIATIKKKQRGILLKMEKERDAIKRLLQSTTTTNSTESTSTREVKELVSPLRKSKKSGVPQQANSKHSHKFGQACHKDKILFSKSAAVDEHSKRTQSSGHELFNVKNPRSNPVVRANYDLESSRSLEDLLRKREIDLQRRRGHVERLMQWHRCLDQEEAEVLQMENQLLTYSSRVQSKIEKVSQNHASVVNVKNNCAHTKVQRRLKEIENSLKQLNNISSTSTGSNEISRKNDGIECVHTTGSKLNKLWRRLTSQHCEKYEPNKYYNLSKSDLEALYEAAKVAVLQDFTHNEGSLAADLLEKSILNNNDESSTSLQQKEQVSIPSLNLDTSSESPSDREVLCEETSAHSVLTSKYSPSSAIAKFDQFPENSATGSVCSTEAQLSSEGNTLLKDSTLALNTDAIMRSSNTNSCQFFGLARSLSDTVLYNKHRSLQTNEKATVNDDICKSQEDTNSNISNIANAVEPKELSPLYLDVNSIGQNPRNNSKGIDEDVELKEEVFFETSLQPEINEKFIISSEEQMFQRSSQPNSTRLPFISSKFNDMESKTSSSMDKLENADFNSTADINGSNQEESSSDQNSFNSKTYICKEKSMEADGISNENSTSIVYEDDFENNSELTQLNDVSFPFFESTVELSVQDANDEKNKQNTDSENRSENTNVNNEVPILSDASEVLEKSQIQQPNLEIVSIPPPPPPASDNAHLPTQQIGNGSVSITSSAVQLMPDIINELEIRRCQQILLETEQIIQFDNTSTVPYMYVREIPNKPPPPYVPPAHGSPMTTIFPSEERIKEISYRRTHELYCELLKTEYVSECGKKLPSVMDEKITNIYERIILDICREYLDEHSEVLTQGDPVNFHTQLAFFNPPNRLQCIQESVYKEVRRCLAMNKAVKRRTPVYSVYGQRANSDHIGKIIIQEMYDEDDKWCNFHREENEVIELIIYEVVGKCISNIAKEVLVEESGMIGAANKEDEAEKNESINLCLDTTDQPNDSDEVPIGQEF